jgi:hypothetical protein
MNAVRSQTDGLAIPLRASARVAFRDGHWNAPSIDAPMDAATRFCTVSRNENTWLKEESVRSPRCCVYVLLVQLGSGIYPDGAWRKTPGPQPFPRKSYLGLDMILQKAPACFKRSRLRPLFPAPTTIALPCSHLLNPFSRQGRI